MSGSPLDFRIPEISVEGTNKTWGGPTNQANGTVITFTAIPLEGKPPWTPEQAEVIAFDLRRRIQILLMADAQVRNTPPPPGGREVLESYTRKVALLKSKVSGCEWREKSEPLSSTDETVQVASNQGSSE